MTEDGSEGIWSENVDGPLFAQGVFYGSPEMSRCFYLNLFLAKFRADPPVRSFVVFSMFQHGMLIPNDQ